METISEQRSFGGTQGFYRHDAACCGPMDLSVYVPPAAEHGPCPVVYYLSGLTCTPKNVTEKSGFQRVAAELGLIVVAPDSSPRGAGCPGEDDDWDFGTGASFYVDATVAPWSERYRMYSYVTEELPALVDEHFPTKGTEHRSIFGHSMGGHGALVIGLRQPDRWRAISAFAPICAPMRVPWGKKAFTGYLGEDERAWRAYDATELVKKGSHPGTILIDQGTDDGFLKEQLEPERFGKACAAAGQALELRMQPGYDHSYYFIATFMEDHLRHHGRVL